MSTRTRALLIGATGRMGQAIRLVAESAPDIIIAEIATRGDALAAGKVDVVIDFTQPGATREICNACVAAKKPLVSGTTGHSAEERAHMINAAQSIAIVQAANFSIGVNALFALTRSAAAMLGPEFDLEIVETHHRLKKDAPSGTAKRLAAILGETRELQVAHGREGLPGERPADQIGIHAIRGGDVVGDHTVIFAGRGERVELTHRASNRETFAAGALRAAQWIVDQSPGFYSMEDVLGLTSGR